MTKATISSNIIIISTEWNISFYDKESHHVGDLSLISVHLSLLKRKNQKESERLLWSQQNI